MIYQTPVYLTSRIKKHLHSVIFFLQKMFLMKAMEHCNKKINFEQKKYNMTENSSTALLEADDPAVKVWVLVDIFMFFIKYLSALRSLDLKSQVEQLP